MNLKQKEQREIIKARKTMSTVLMPGYLAYMLTILSMVH